MTFHSPPIRQTQEQMGGVDETAAPNVVVPDLRPHLMLSHAGQHVTRGPAREFKAKVGDYKQFLKKPQG